jgi:quinol monooxygenase YgiN
VVVVLSELTITEVSVSDFKSALQTYCEASKTQDGCHHIFLRSFASTTNFAIYEVWDSQDSWQKHFSSKSYKAFQKTVIDYLEAPQAVKVMPMPGGLLKLLSCYPYVEGILFLLQHLGGKTLNRFEMVK